MPAWRASRRTDSASMNENTRFNCNAPHAGLDMDTDKAYFWERLLQAIESGKVVPVVGREALQVATGDGSVTYEHLVAQQLASAYRVDISELPPGFDLNDVVCRLASFRGTAPQDCMSRIVAIHQAMQVEPPEALRSLARIPAFGLFVSLTFDHLLEKALRMERGRPPVVASYPSSTDVVDFEPAALDAEGSMVFHLLGRCSPLRRFAITEGQVLEGLHAVMSNENRPRKLIDRLRDSHILLLGAGLPDWPSRFLLRMARPGPLWNDRDTDEIVAGRAQDGLPTFLHRFSPEHSMTYHDSPASFARELEQRWFERFPPAASDEGRMPQGMDGREGALPVAEDAPEAMTGGAVFLSYAREDRGAAFKLADQLERGGIDVWVDRRLEPGDAYRRIIERNIVNSCAFVALLSGTTQDPSPRWYRREWSIAAKQNEAYFGTSTSFIFPVIVDASSSRDHAETLSLFGSHGTQASRAPAGVPDEQLLQSLNRTQRMWRKLHAARP